MLSETTRSDAVLKRLLTLHPKKIDLALDRILRLLAGLGNPHLKLPPVIHVAGTNGKGSACAFTRAMLEAQGLKVHVHTSPHLVRFHERIRLAGKLISEEALVSLLEEVEEVNQGREITFFEITAAAMFLAFSRYPADAVVLEVGLGGAYDATNVVPNPAMTVIQPVGMDHKEFLGDDLAGIAAEKAGIIKKGSPLVVGPQNEIARHVILRQADRLGVALFEFGQDFASRPEHGRMVYEDGTGLLDLPLPKLVGRHQIENAGVAIAALRHANHGWGQDTAIERGLSTVEWPARLQRLHKGPLVESAPKGAEVWLDGGHNPHGAEAVSRAMADMEEHGERPLYLICGMLANKDALGYLRAFNGLARHVVTVAIPGEAGSMGAGALYDVARRAGLDSAPAEDLDDAMLQVTAWTRLDAQETPPRILICGSLYLAGKVLAENG
ncbi:MAG TPA: folylpolyglutamate synthase/dihydrofolate synthase family protein [Rhizomicrobium sp.]|jgi:dihydrofolate synthase/folylpolyglutamate synthase|nr:folylpolyglutamate synthase/dihydrofolate synthase family protein [Rhizomicrobium sp.]